MDGIFDNMSEAEFMEDGADYLEDADESSPNIHGYVVACIGRSSGRTVYLQQKEKGGYWTQFLENARVFRSSRGAEMIMRNFRYGNPHVMKI